MPSAKDLFGKRLRELRIERHLSQEKLSEMCDFHPNHVGRLERAERTITFDGIQRLAYALKVRPFEFLALLPIPRHLPPKNKKRDE
ncbi:MAG TPA: helix-turn-helix transcriptional regulator [Terriglobales bacterium]|nr:helix-turn-helix transcriptional regulator [Terriglobales bacterium]